LFGAKSAHQPERPPEPRLSGVHPEEAEWDDGTQLRLLGRGSYMRKAQCFVGILRSQDIANVKEVATMCNVVY